MLGTRSTILKGFAAVVGVSILAACAAFADNVRQPNPGQQTSPIMTPSGGVILDDTQPGWIWNGMVEFQDQGLHGGSAHAGGPGRYGAYTFTGTGIEVFGMKGPVVTVDGRAHRMGSMKISIDGNLKASVSQHTGDFVFDCSMARITGLSNGIHVLQTEPDGGWIVVDYIAVMNGSGDVPDGTNTSTTGDGRRADPSAQTGNPGQQQPSSNGPLTPSGGRSSTPQFTGRLTDGYYRICPKNGTSMYLIPVGNMTANGTKLQIIKAPPQANQVWHVTQIASGYYHLSPPGAPDSALTMAPRKSDQVRSAAVIWQYTGDATQVLQIKPGERAGFTIAPGANANGAVLDATHGSFDSGPAEGSSYEASDNQLWRFEPVR